MDVLRSGSLWGKACRLGIVGSIMMRFIETDLSQLPVVEHDSPDTVLGLLNRQHVFKAYTQTLRALTKEQ